MNVTLIGKNVEVRLSRTAQRALAERATPLQAEMELLFSCLIRKRVRFSEQVAQDAIAVSDQLSVRFRPAMTRACVLSDLDGTPPLDDFPIVNPRPYVPRWLSIDYRCGQWVGEFGY
ncbi:hypothetical protein SKTS_22720 [Sulfurimicrobium lacus]|uniref:Uncharacterized protein n=1 Tax=Sulfurimicrobium lacus TaxID=2715678 RepID=A0A6F8VED1_9PROT|nr:hypothetical protein [Sulfurimicrobium lacus]BCB27386.1 hypothetical protein SKTS_22720 [Sulfurimicrobium lacus]